MSLTLNEKNSLRLALDALQERLQIQHETHHVSDAQIDSSAGDEVIADVLEGHAMAQSLHQETEWQALQRARLRFEDHLSDVCIDCAGPIPFARLEAEPTAQRCIACQSALETTDQRLHLHPHSTL